MLRSIIADAGLWTEAKDLLERHIASLTKEENIYPMVLYALGYFPRKKRGRREGARIL